MDNKQKSPLHNNSPKADGKIDAEERNRLMRKRIDVERQCLFDSEPKQAAMRTEVENGELQDCVNFVDKENTENLEQIRNHQKSLAHSSKALVTKQQDAVKRLDSLEQQADQFIGSSLIPNDDKCDNDIRQLEDRNTEEDEKIANRLPPLSKKKHVLRELNNELGEINKTENSVRLELPPLDIEQSDKQTGRYLVAKLVQNVDNIINDHVNKMSVINSDIDTLENIIKDERNEFRDKMMKAYRENSRLKDELKLLQEELKNRRSKAASAKSPVPSGSSFHMEAERANANKRRHTQLTNRVTDNDTQKLPAKKRRRSH